MRSRWTRAGCMRSSLPLRKNQGCPGLICKYSILILFICSQPRPSNNPDRVWKVVLNPHVFLGVWDWITNHEALPVRVGMKHRQAFICFKRIRISLFHVLGRCVHQRLCAQAGFSWDPGQVCGNVSQDWYLESWQHVYWMGHLGNDPWYPAVWMERN